MSRSLLDHGEAGELLIWLMPAGLLAGIGVRQSDWLTVGAVAGAVLGFATLVLVLVLWLANRAPRVREQAEPLAIEPPKPVSPSAAGVFVVDAVAAGDGGA